MEQKNPYTWVKRVSNGADDFYIVTYGGNCILMGQKLLLNFFNKDGLHLQVLTN